MPHLKCFLSERLPINVICIYISGEQMYFNDLAIMSEIFTDHYLLPLINSIIHLL